ncbi:MAG TPA: ribosome small subunit-dependent GTPase A [Caulifigura sp.]|nr:ribosome small subunit-dependent GTPase A [Caulifigura sp.]
MARDDKRKIRVSFRKNRNTRARQNDWTKAREDDAADAISSERLSGKGDLTRRRTVVTSADNPDGLRDVDLAQCVPGRVLWTVGANHSAVELDDGTVKHCSVRRVLRTRERETRSLVVAGDRVMVRPTEREEGVIERIELRTSTISRMSGRFQQVLTANVDQAVIVVSADDPPLKLGVVDRFLVGAEKGGVRGVVCINKADLVNPVLLQPIAGQYARIGYDVVLVSARLGLGIEELRQRLIGHQSVVAGQSGVGKSSLLNCVQPGLAQRTGGVSEETGKGTHTTRVAELFRLEGGGWVVDTPGIRQLMLWDVARGELEGLFPEFRPYVPDCRFASCSHLVEKDCAVQAAIERGDISPLRYETYTRMFNQDDDPAWAAPEDLE